MLNIMASMSTEIAVLRALLHLSRRSSPATLSDVIDRVARDPRDVQRALAAFARAQLVQRNGEHVRFSLAGLAVAVAAVRHYQTTRRAKTVAQPRVVSMVRRRRAA